MAATSDSAGATQKQLLALVQAKGNAQKALILLVHSGVADELPSPSLDVEKATALLRIGVTRERPTPARSSPKPSSAKSRDAKKAKEADKQWALVSAKVAQSVIKLYIGGGADTTTAPDSGDLACALDLATLALSVACQFESLVKLGDFVLENMLYQVAKKLGETPQFTPRALWIFAALHVRLWKHHVYTCATLNHKSLSGEDSPFRVRADELLAKKEKAQPVLDDLVALCTFPAPQSFHTLQYTRFLISLVNAAVNMLLASGKNQAILQVTKMLEPWIIHLSRIPGVDTKLSASFSNRLFRVLWKCAAAVDTQEKVTGQDGSLEYRSLALAFMLKCPNYSNSYFIQQVHRVGLQYEKKAFPTGDNDRGILLYKFYTASANALFGQRIQQGKGFKAPTIEWDYVIWLEHFASVCDLQPHAVRSRTAVDALTVLHHATDHLSPKDPVSRIVASCLLAMAGSVIVEQRCSSNCPPSASISEKEIRQILSSDILHSTVAPKHQDTIVVATVYSDCKPRDGRWIEPVKLYLDGIQDSCVAAREATTTPTEVQLGLVLRLARKVSTRLFSVLTTATEIVDGVADIILSSIIALGDLLSLLRKNEAIGITGSLEDSFLSLEGRVRRLSISLSAKRSVATSDEQALTHLAVLTKQVGLYQQTLCHAMSDTGKQRSSMPSLLNDLQAIAREAYTCATHYYKKQLFEHVERALEAAFQLAETYLQQVTCNELSSKSSDQVEDIHGSLKVDALASLLAFSCRQQGKTTSSRKYHGYAILYSSDPNAVANTGTIGKYVDAVIDGYQDLSSSQGDAEEETVDSVLSLCESVASAWNSRGVDKDTVTSMIRLFGDGFQHCSNRLLDQLRLSSDNSKDESTSQDHRIRVKLFVCTKVGVRIWKLLWEREGGLPKSWMMAMESVLSAISKRKEAFCDYFVDRDSSAAVKGLWAANEELTQALDQLSTPNDPGHLDSGGCYGWRGVFTLEICQMEAYAALGKGSGQHRENTTSTTEEKALEDIRQCLAYWNNTAIVALKRPATHVFDARGIGCCLDAICHALSLMSHLQLESQARALLAAIQKSSSLDRSAATNFGIGLPSIMLQPAYLASDVPDTTKKRSVPSGDGCGQLHLGVIDADIGLCLASICGAELLQARVHLSSAVAGMNALRSAIKFSSDDTHMYSAVAMRELAISMAESEVVFHEGNLAQAIREAKSALSICWKISKKVGIVDTDRERYELPDEIKTALGKYADQSHKVVAFQAIECWSWDILLASKLILSRIAYLYVLSNQPFRSSVYYAEAMTLVSGVVPTVTRRRPFLDFAQLQILAERTNHAMAVHELVAFSSESEVDVTDQDDTIDASVIIQNSEVQLQRGDLYFLEGKEDKSRECYEQCLRLVARVDRLTPALSCISSGCYRRLLKLQLRVAVIPWEESIVDRILDVLKKLKRELKKCTNLVEYALATCQLVQTSMALLRSSSSKAFLPVEKLAVLMQDVRTRCDHLSIVHVNQEVRFTLGLIYLMRSESGGRTRDESLHVTMNWAAAGYLSNYQVVGPAGEDWHSGDNASDTTRARSGVQSTISEMDARIQNLLPPTWLIVSITVGQLSDFTISLVPTNGHEPISFWMGTIKWAERAQELGDIIEASRKTLFGTAGTTGTTEEWTPDKKKQWWDTRNELDDRLRILLTKIQDALGFWRALLTFTPEPEPSPKLAALLQAIASKVHRNSRALNERSSWLLGAVHDAHTVLTDVEISQCIDHVAIEENVSIPHELTQHLVTMIRASSESSELSNQRQASSTILVLHHRLEKFPWEGLDVLRERSVTRMPSIELILQNADQAGAVQTRESNVNVTAIVDPANVSFLLNPAGDLKSTQSNLEPIFRRGEADQGWRGVVGEAPDEDWMRQTLVDSSLFVYCGHGSGEKYFHRDKIAALRRHGCAAVLLFGCSSGRLEREGVFGPNGAVISYLEAGSPAVLAMLWDVTDKDVDLMCKCILEDWLLASREKSRELLSVVLQRSRRLCKLQHLNGLAAVCYGLPLRTAGHESTTAGTRATKRRKVR